jgi:hypothetical protein
MSCFLFQWLDADQPFSDVWSRANNTRLTIARNLFAPVALSFCLFRGPQESVNGILVRCISFGESEIAGLI